MLLGDIVSLLKSLATDRSVSSVLRERLLYAIEKLADVEKELADLKVKNRQLIEEFIQAQKELDSLRVPDQFTEYRGVLFKRDAAGRYAPVAYCPRCKNPLWNNDPSIFPYECSTPGCEFKMMIEEPLKIVAARLDKINGM